MENKETEQVNISYLVLYAKYESPCQSFDANFISKGEFEANKLEDFATMKKWALKNGKSLGIIALEYPPLVRIIPEVKIINNLI